MSCTAVSNFDDFLNLESMHNWPVNKQLTDEDVRSCLTLLTEGVEKYIMPRLPLEQSENLVRNSGKTVMAVYDVERSIRYDMKLVKEQEGGYKLEDWDQVSMLRRIQASQGIGMSWRNGMLHFKIFSN
jgi:hypothetical protein